MTGYQKLKNKTKHYEKTLNDIIQTMRYYAAFENTKKIDLIRDIEHQISKTYMEIYQDEKK